MSRREGGALEEIVSKLKAWFERYVQGFDDGDPGVRENMALKADHTRRVCENMVDIGTSLRLSPLDLSVAEAAAFLHDIGRFEQYRRYRTFADSKSEDHGALGVSIIRENRVLAAMPPVQAEIVLRAVACHNRLSVPESTDERFLTILKMLRDADKVDIWRVVTEYYRRSTGTRNPAVELDLPDEGGVSDIVYESLMRGEPVRMADLRILNDFKLLQMGWIYDLNFSRSFQMVIERGYLEEVRNALPKASRRVDEVYAKVRAHLESGGGGKRSRR